MDGSPNNCFSETISEIKMEKNAPSSYCEGKESLKLRISTNYADGTSKIISNHIPSSLNNNHVSKNKDAIIKPKHGVSGDKKEHKVQEGKEIHHSSKNKELKNNSNVHNTPPGTHIKHKDSIMRPKEHINNSKEVKQKENSVSSTPKEGHHNSINKAKESDVLKKPKLHKSSSEHSETKHKDSSTKPKEIKSNSLDNHNHSHSSSKSKDHISNNKPKESSNNKDSSNSIKPKENKHKESSSGSKKPVDSHGISMAHKDSGSGSNKSKESTGISSTKPKDATHFKSKDMSNSSSTNKTKDSSERNSNHSSIAKTDSIKLKSNSDKLNNSSSYKAKEGDTKDVKISNKSADKSEIKKSVSDTLDKRTDKHGADVKVRKEGENKHLDKENVDRKESYKDKSKDSIAKESRDKSKEVLKRKDTKERSEPKIKTEPSPSSAKGPSFSHGNQGNHRHEKVTIKSEPLSDDDVPLAARKSSLNTSGFETNKGIKKEKRPLYDDGDSEDEPIALRIEKSKKFKKEETKKKRKVEKSDDEFEPILKKSKKEINNKTIQAKTGSPTKRKKEEETQEVWKWWEEDKYDSGMKWKTLEHKGPVFAPEYEPLPKDVKFFYKGKHVALSSPAEEVATFYAKLLDHEYTTKEAFNKNFLKDWRKTMTPEERDLITDLALCDFKQMHSYFLNKSEERKNMTKEEKLEIKQKNEELQKCYGFCVIDGHKEKIGNFKIEPPGLFRGRGEHPKMGKLKKRIMPEHVIINCGKGSVVPKPPNGHKWKEVRHDNTVTWLACWQENIQGQTKYIMLNPSSKLKGEKDWQKYETARKLKSCVDTIRSNYRNDWKSKEMKVRQRAVALYFIDKLALRAGNEKEEGETADTVGCCSLRVEHITLDEEKNGEQYVVNFDFLGKDSIRYVNSVPVEKRVFKNLQLFMENKQPGDDLFDRLNTAILNKHLNELMDGLTAKVFRTYNASKTLQEQLEILTNPNDPIPAKLLSYNRANRAVAVLCNHQRSVPKTFGKSMENLQTKIKAKEDQVKEAEKDLRATKKDLKNSRSEKDKTLLQRKEKAVSRLKEQLMKLELQATDKEENKQIALSTSKLNYLDPRITVAWCKKWEVPVEKVFNRTHRDKFRWAIEMAGPDFVF